MRESFLRAIEAHGMLESGDSVLIALSGGADSVALCRMLKEVRERYSLRLGAAHLHHGIRGGEADRDQDFCRKFCDENGLLFFSGFSDIPKLAAQEKLSVEDCGRRERYAFLEKTAQEKGFNKIATGHNLDDNAETVIINLTRGSGLKGLLGIPPVRGNIIRPLIDCPRTDIERYLEKLGQSFVNDSTNDSMEYSRCRVRKEVIPALKEINASFPETVKRMNKSLGEAYDYIDAEIERIAGVYSGAGGGINIPLCEFNPLSAVVKKGIIGRAFKEISGRALSFAQLEEVAALCAGGRHGKRKSLYGVSADLSYGRLTIRADNGSVNNEIEYHELLSGDSGRIFIDNAGISISWGAQKKAETAACGGDSIRMLFDFSVFCDKVIARPRKEKDSYVPCGGTHIRTVKKMMIENKIPVAIRACLPVFEQDGNVIGAAGLRTARGFEPKPSGKTMTVEIIIHSGVKL